jgi:type IV pilus assembly protein PilY1
MWFKEHDHYKIVSVAWLLTLFFSCSLQNADAAQMNDYCITPPYIGASIEPNLLLMIDNSASMYDLTYTDSKNKYCANATTTTCTSDSTCMTLSSGPTYTAACILSAITSTVTTTTGGTHPACTTDADCNDIAGDCALPYCKTGGDAVCGGIANDCFDTGAGHTDYCKTFKQCNTYVTPLVTTTLINYTPIQCTADTDCSSHTPGDTCNNKCNVIHSCYDDTYDNTKICSVTSTTSCTSNADCPSGEQCVGKYSGYFDRSATYSYSSGKFTSGATMPGTCTYSASSGGVTYVCVNTSGTPEAVTDFTATGNFLNWLTMSKFDVEKQILTGGKYDTTNNVLTAETRGCSGRKFIKNIVPGLTFAIRGGQTAGAIKITSQATEYGQTFIEIYRGIYNAAACSAAVADWMNITTTNLGPLQGDTNCCLAGGTKTNGCNPSNTSLTANQQTIHDCFWYFNGHGLSNLNPIENACIKDWAKTDPSAIASIGDADAICSKVLDHPPSLVDGNILGFLGLCYNFISKSWNAGCALTEQKDFCQTIGGTAAVTDPAPSTIVATTVQNVPGFVMEAGLDSLVSIGTLTVQAARSIPPSGLINQYQGLIRFGAMTFQNNGSLSECNQSGICAITGTSCVSDSGCSPNKCIFSIPCVQVCSTTTTRQCFQDSDCPGGETCTSLGSTGVNLNADGGIIPPYAYVGHGVCCDPTTTPCTPTATPCDVDSECTGNEICAANVGDHSSGLIQSIDNIVASSWTPFAEGFYNAMGYFSRSNDYPVPPAKATPTSRDFNFTNTPSSALRYNTSKNPSQIPCQKNNVLLITDGMSTADLNSQETGMSSLYRALVTSNVGTDIHNYNSQCSYSGSTNLPVLTWLAKNRNIKNPNLDGVTALVGGDIQKVCTNDFSETCGSDADCGAGNTCTNIPTRSSESINTYIVYSGPSATTSSTLCDPLTLVTAAAKNGGTTIFEASNVSQLQSTLASAFDQVAARAASGTAASVLASGEGSGANLVQAVFYPHKRFTYSDNTFNEISWIGRLTNLWYYVDPFINNSSIREDDGIATAGTNTTPWMGDKTLHLQTDLTHRDYIINMYYDKTAGVTKAHRWTDPNGNGVIGATVPDINFEDLGYLWEAGTLLWRRDPATRTIKTTVTGNTLTDFTAANAATLAPFLNTSETTTIINWVRGQDFPNLLRPRTVKIESVDSTPRVWKLGDVVNSTPRLLSWQALNNYYRIYGDTTYGDSGTLESAADINSFVTTTAYKKRGMVFAGGNDGMLHAFKLGTLRLTWSGQGATEKARLEDPDTGALCNSSISSPTCGQELWAYIPKNVLPYLQYMADTGYCHLNSVDLTPFIFDTSISGTPNTTRAAGSWKTVLIGGMRFGGACKNMGVACSGGGTDCVKNPMNGVGYSSYFALDITNPNSPILLWNFSDPSLGFTTTGPAVVRINSQTAGVSDGNSTNGNWFVVFGSGPTGPISTTDHQFLGRSDQNLKIFILDLAKPVADAWALNTNYWVKDTGIPNAFAGSIMGATLDIDKDYQDDILYIPYVKKASDGTWTDGGVGRLVTNDNPNDPGTNWAWSPLIDGIGPVTSAVGKLYDAAHGNLWVFFGTGRYYYVQNTGSDDPSGQRYLFGIKDPCVTSTGLDVSCTSSRAFCANGCTNSGCTLPTTCGDLTNVMDTANIPTPDTADSGSFNGWYISLDPAGAYTYSPDVSTNFTAERQITDPLAASSGVTYFTTYKPFTDLCQLGGKSFIWALQYNTGGPPTNLKGKVLMQVSTGSIEQKDLATAFTDKGGRKSASMDGKPPEIQGLSVIAAPPPVNRIIHIRER